MDHIPLAFRSLTAVLAAVVMLALPPAVAHAKSGSADMMIPGIWVDPDGCEHWVMDDGFEGYMSPVVLPSGRPVCGRNPAGPRLCGIVSTDSFFATDSATIAPYQEALLRQFFRDNRRRVFQIEGHTDSRASRAHNMNLSLRRADAVAEIGRSVNARIEAVRGRGEGFPRASNRTREGMAMNRRVEIICVN